MIELALLLLWRHFTYWRDASAPVLPDRVAPGELPAAPLRTVGLPSTADMRAFAEALRPVASRLETLSATFSPALGTINLGLLGTLLRSVGEALVVDSA